MKGWIKMFKMNIDYINCNTVYEYTTEQERQERLENLIWVWDMKQIDNNIWKAKSGTIVELI